MKRADASAPGDAVLLGGRWRLGARIGAGGMGAVFEAEHATLGRRVAVKLIDPERVTGPGRASRFAREATIAAAIHHEHVVAVIDHGGGDGAPPFLVMERLHGLTAAALVRESGPLPVERAVGIVAQACRGIAAAHATHVLHRDVKPSNLFVSRRSDGSDWVKVLDFGVAQILDDDESTLTGSDDVIGSPHYMAPEQAVGAPDLDERVDVYGLGAVLFELLTGRPPHPGTTRMAALAHAMNADPEPLAVLRSDVPPRLAAVCARALARDRAARFASARELEEALHPWLPAPGVADDDAAPSQRAVRARAESEPAFTRTTARGLTRRRSRGRAWLALFAAASCASAWLAVRARGGATTASSSAPAAASAAVSFIDEGTPGPAVVATVAASPSLAAAASASSGVAFAAPAPNGPSRSAGGGAPRAAPVRSAVARSTSAPASPSPAPAGLGLDRSF